MSHAKYARYHHHYSKAAWDSGGVSIWVYDVLAESSRRTRDLSRHGISREKYCNMVHTTGKAFCLPIVLESRRET
jgi:hypothetical protein